MQLKPSLEKNVKPQMHMLERERREGVIHIVLLEKLEKKKSKLKGSPGEEIK
jgi:hypothetical protein